MSQICHQSRDFVVYDDVLTSAAFGELFRYLNSLQYRSVHASGWRKVWRLHDGNPLTSGASWYYPNPPHPDASKQVFPKQIFPTRTALDGLVTWIEAKLPELQTVVGRHGTEWCRLSLAPWVYPLGSGLSLHRDGHKYSGAFTFFAHPEWGLHWGGHLLVLDPKTEQRATTELSPSFLGDKQETARAFTPGIAVTVFAKPNRIVFLSPHAQHLMTRVDVNAGNSPRLSLAGFFHKS